MMGCSVVATPLVPGTITPDSMPPEQLEELLALLQAGEARLVGPQGEEHLVPAPLYGLLRGLLDNLKRGEAITVLPHDALLTTQQAAQILNISRPYLYRLIEQRHHVRSAKVLLQILSRQAQAFSSRCREFHLDAL